MFTIEEILGVKSLLDRNDAAARQQALVALRGFEMLLTGRIDHDGYLSSSHQVDSYSPAPILNPQVAATILECACQNYPVLEDDAVSPADMLVQLLWASPESVSATQIRDAYMDANRPVRRSLLHLLSLHPNSDAVSVLAHLVGPHGPPGLAPAPIRVLLAPLLRHTHPDRIGADVVSRELVPTAIWLCTQSDWVFEATRFLKSWIDMAAHSPTGIADVVQRGDIDLLGALDTLSNQMQEHIAICNRHWDVTHIGDVPGVTSTWAQAALTDPVRGDRFRIEALLEVVEAINTALIASNTPDETVRSRVLSAGRRVLMSADPQVSAMGAVALLRAESRVGLDRLDMIVRDSAARQRLYDGLQAIPNWLEWTDAAPSHYPTWWLNQQMRAESAVVAWLCEVTQLGCPPHEIEWLATIDSATEAGHVEVFRFRMRDPHWSTGRDWMIAIGGPVTRSDFEAEDEYSLTEHVQLLISRDLSGEL